MTVASTTTPLIQYNGNGVTTAFSTVFTFNTQADLIVVLTSSLGVDTTQVLTTNYTVSGGSGSTGTVTMLVAPASGQKLTIQRSTALTQSTDYVENDSFPAAVHEAALDKLTYISQELQENLSRAFTVSETSGVNNLEIEAIPDAFVRWNSAGDALESVTLQDFDAVAFNGTGILANDGTSTLQARTITGTTNQITVSNGSGVSGNPTISLPATLDLSGSAVTLQDNNLTIQDNSDTTKKATFQLSGITTGTTRTLTVPDNSGTIALTSDITGGAPTTAQYVTLATDGTLSNERVLTAGSGVVLTDAGAGSTLTASLQAGTVLQTVTTTLTSATTTTSSTHSTILTANITPASASNSVLIMATVNISANNTSTFGSIRCQRGGSTIGQGDTASNRIRTGAGITGSAIIANLTYIFLDSPATTSSTAYTIQVASTDNSNVVGINRHSTDSDTTVFTRGISSLVVMEIKG